jgi:hypothetical protein
MRWLLNLWPFVTKRFLEKEADEWCGLLSAEIEAKLAECDRRRAAEKAAGELAELCQEAVNVGDELADAGVRTVEIAKGWKAKADELAAELAAADENAALAWSVADSLGDRVKAAEARADEAASLARRRSAERDRARAKLAQIAGFAGAPAN